MPEPTRENILEALTRIKTPDGTNDVVGAGLVQGLIIKHGNVGFMLEIEPDQAEKMEPVRHACEQAVRALPGVLSATAVLTAERNEAAPPAAPPKSATGPKGLPNIKSIIAVASGKGGVGKSTTAVNLALGLQAQGLKVGMLDADIYGPSLPRMLGISGGPSTPDGKRMYPMQRHGLDVMSIGFLLDEDTPTIWRGPMVQGALQQMMNDVIWSELDVLVVDMPPGTGDAHLTISQQVPLLGVVIVSTPQDIALIDARKGLNMFRRVNVPVFGIVENMSYFVCPHCGERSDIFSHGGAAETAKEIGCDFLGEIPLHIRIRETSDAGEPIVVSAPESAQAQAYLDIAKKVAKKIEVGLKIQAESTPTITFE